VKLSTRLALILGLAAPAAISAQAKPHDIDAAHSEINFVAEARLISAHGFFGKWTADVAYDAAKPENSTIALKIDPASINTRNDRRDGHLKSPDFFDVAKFPEITFASKRVVAKGNGQFDIVGDLTMHGVTKEITAPAKTMFYEGGRGRFKGTLTIKRSEFGVNGNSRMNPIADDIEVQFELSIVEKKQG
jgi:polyisoprenoid-binding protein YceI